MQYKTSLYFIIQYKDGGVDMVDQQLHSLTVMRKSYKWYKRYFVRMMMCVLSAHKLFQTQGETMIFFSLCMMS